MTELKCALGDHTGAVVVGAKVVVTVVVGAKVVVTVVVGAKVVVTVVVGADVVAGADDAAWAGVMTESTIGFDHLLGSMTTVATPPIMTVFMTCRRLNFLFLSMTQ